jgi:hypothetical protein
MGATHGRTGGGDQTQAPVPLNIVPRYRNARKSNVLFEEAGIITNHYAAYITPIEPVLTMSNAFAIQA